MVNGIRMDHERKKKNGQRSRVRSTDEEADSKRHWAAEKIQVQLLTTEEKYRSKVLYQQIQAFEDKIYLCDTMFNTDMLYGMFKELSKRNKATSELCTIQGLRQAFRSEARRLTMRNRTRKPGFANKEPDRMMQYFSWFFDYIKYLRELRSNFVERIFNPLFKYFYETGNDGPEKERSLDSTLSLSNLSVHSHRSRDSNGSKVSRYSSTSDLSTISEMTISSLSSMAASDGEGSSTDIHATRQKMLSRAALHLLGREFRDIKNLYDSTDVEQIAQRLSILKEQIDYLLDNEDKINFDMFSQDSENAVHHLKLKNLKVHCLFRLLPDVAVKCKKAAWLAKRWLKLDDAKTKDLNRKMNKLASIEGQLSRRLSVLTIDIQKHEHELEEHLGELQRLMKREERSNDLHLAWLEAEDKREKMTRDMEKLEKEREDLIKNIKIANERGRLNEVRNMKTMYERNKLQRYAMGRQMAAISFHQTLIDRDINLELEVKPNIIHFTNDVQDRCEELEKLLEKERNEKKTIEAALLPIIEDRGSVTERLCASQMNASVPFRGVPGYLSAENTPRGNSVIAQIENRLSGQEADDDDVFEDSTDNDVSPRSYAMYVRTLKNSRKFSVPLQTETEVTSDWS